MNSQVKTWLFFYLRKKVKSLKIITEKGGIKACSEKITPTPFRPPKQYKLSPQQPKNKKYKVLKNGTVG